MKKVLGFIATGVFVTIVAVALYQLAFVITPWFMSQKLWVVLLFWMILAWPIKVVLALVMSVLVGLPVMFMANTSAARIIPTLVLLVMGFLACCLPWSLDSDYNALNVIKAVILDIAYAFVFLSTISMIWTEKPE